MNVHILIFSIVRDIPYLEYCLRSIKKYATGFTGVTIAVPIQEQLEFISKTAHFPDRLNGTVKFYNAPDNRELWHISHQGEKCRADHYVPGDTDLILFTDSDCIFIAPVSPADYIQDGKPELLIERFDSITGNPWQKPTEEILKTTVPHETMRRHPAVHWREMFPEMRKHVETVQGMDFTPFVLTRKPDFPWGISEFCLMGAFILKSLWKDKYSVIDLTGGNPHPPSSKKLFQFWSHSPIDKPQSSPWGQQVVPLEYMKSIGL